MNADITAIDSLVDSPVDAFSDCHMGILKGLRAFADLPPVQDAAVRARTLAEQVLSLFDDVILDHHAQEEQELFTAVARSARPGAEREHVDSVVLQLTAEHRELEGLWKRLRPEVKAIAYGKPSKLRQQAVNLLVEVYASHARFEEREFLPLAQEILGRDGNHLAALGMSLHMRHVHLPSGYI